MILKLIDKKITSTFVSVYIDVCATMTDAGAADADVDFTTEAKYKQFSYEVEKALRNFELSTEWPDLISALAKP